MDEPTYCFFNEKRFSIGSKTCQNGQEYVCTNDGSWQANGYECNANIYPTFYCGKYSGSTNKTSLESTNIKLQDNLLCCRVVEGEHAGPNLRVTNICTSYYMLTILWDGVVSRDQLIYPNPTNNPNVYTYCQIPPGCSKYDLVKEVKWGA